MAVVTNLAGGQWNSINAPGALDAATGLTAPPPSGDASTDFAVMRDFFELAPAGARIVLIPGALYPLYSGAFRVKPGQIVDLNGAVIQRPAEIVTTTTSTVADGSTSVQVASVTGFQVGMTINVVGPMVGNSTNILQTCLQIDTNQALRIQAIDVDTKTITFEGPVIFTTSTTGGAVGAIAAGATLAVKGALLDACSKLAGGVVTIVNGVLNGNRAANATNNRWECTTDLRVNSNGGYFENINVINSPGEGVVTNGNSSVFNNFKFSNLNGNCIHFNGYSRYTKLSQIDVDTCNLDYSIGHANGAIIASNNVYNTILSDFDIRNARLFGVGSFDQSDNAFAKVSNGFISGCWGGGLGLFGTNAGASSGLDVRNVTITNCGTSYLGIDRTGSVTVECTRRYDIDLVLVDSMIMLGGLADSSVKIRSYHKDTATLTSTNAAAGRASNYAGKINATSINGGASLNLGSDVMAQVELYPCIDSVFDIVTVDKAAAPTGGTFGIRTVYSADAGGPWLNCVTNFSTKGSDCGVLVQGVFRNCRGVLQADDNKLGNAIYIFLRTNTNKNTMFPTAAAAGVVGVTVSNVGSGGATVRTQYPLVFVGGTQVIAAKGTFVVENGKLVSVQMDRPGDYSAAPALSFAAAPGLTGVVASLTLGATQDMSVSDNNDFTLNAHHSNQPGAINIVRLRQDSVNSIGCGWSTIRGKVRVDAGAGAGLTDTGTALHHIHLSDIELRGPASGWLPLAVQPAATANVNRMSNVRTTAAAYSVPANWAIEPWATASNAVRSVAQ
ncbi:MAG: hypothetical protein V4476_17705 [Pseudomonadota bacterium]